MKWLLRFFWMIWARQTGRRVLHQAKARGVLLYLKSLSITRKTLMVVLLATIVAHLFLMTVIGTIVTGVLLYKEDLHSALHLLFVVFGSISALMLLGLFCLFSQALWYRVSGAKRMVEQIQRDAA